MSHTLSDMRVGRDLYPKRRRGKERVEREGGKMGCRREREREGSRWKGGGRDERQREDGDR